MRRHDFVRDGRKLSYLDDGGDGQPLIALHSHWMEGQTFASLAAALAPGSAGEPGWRVIALDQRGHGYSGHAKTYTRRDYLGDLAALYEHLGIRSAVLLGNSLGGVNAYQFAAKFPERVRALIIEDIGAVINDDTSFALAWAGTFATREELEAKIGARFMPFLKDSLARSFGRLAARFRAAGHGRVAVEPQRRSLGGLAREHLSHAGDSRPRKPGH